MLTFCNLCAGLLAIYLSIKGEAGIACRLVLASVVFDGLDGWAARRLDQESYFGMLFDSAADFVSFGLAPSFIYYNFMRTKDIIVPLVISFYILASAIRLIRFSRSGKNRLPAHDKNFEGLPTTAGAGLLILLFSINLKEGVFFTYAFIAISALMLSRIPFRKFSR